jgi:hypothetical protein
MGASAGFHDNPASGTIGEERFELGALQHLAVNRAGIRFDEMNLEDALARSMAMVVGSIWILVTACACANHTLAQCRHRAVSASDSSVQKTVKAGGDHSDYKATTTKKTNLYLCKVP